MYTTRYLPTVGIFRCQGYHAVATNEKIQACVDSIRRVDQKLYKMWLSTFPSSREFAQGGTRKTRGHPFLWGDRAGRPPYIRTYEGCLFTANRARTPLSVLQNQGCEPDTQGCHGTLSISSSILFLKTKSFFFFTASYFLDNPSNDLVLMKNESWQYFVSVICTV